jgi:hypothetical protein
VPTNVIQLPDDDEEVVQRNAGRRGRASSRRVPARKAPRPGSEPVVQQLDDPVWGTVSFADPLLTDQPSASIAQNSGPIAQPQAPTPLAMSPAPSSTLFVLYHAPEDQVRTAQEAMIQAGVMMDRLEEVLDTSKAAYDASSALQTNVRVSGIVS